MKFPDYDIVVECSCLGKSYRIYDEPKDRLKQSIWRGRKQYYREFWSLKNITFKVGPGETIGIIGKNGSGKSTLLQIICGILSPTIGNITTKGRISALLELGSGFNPEFTGKENVYMNAALLGLTRSETDEKFEDIVAFADIGEFIGQPVKTYSSGMMVRLAFAVQSQVDPDILIVDEALAVGDARFQARCYKRLDQLKERGTSILLVTHSTEQIVKHCSRALLLDNGQLLDSGDPKNISNKYLNLLFGKSIGDTSIKEEAIVNPLNKDGENLDLFNDSFFKRPNYNHLEYRWGDGAAKIIDFEMRSDDGPYPSSIATGSSLTLKAAIRFTSLVVDPIFGVTFKTKDGITVYGTNSELMNFDTLRPTGRPGQVIIIKIRFTCRLAPNDYFISLGIASKNKEGSVVPHDRRYDSIYFSIKPTSEFFGLADMELEMNSVLIQ